MKPYKLMNSLFAHTGDVKGLCATRDDGGFVSVSRDLLAKLWKSINSKSLFLRRFSIKCLAEILKINLYHTQVTFLREKRDKIYFNLNTLST